jgi:hypothetical protein
MYFVDLDRDDEHKEENEIKYAEPLDYFPKEIREKFFDKDDEVEDEELML